MLFYDFEVFCRDWLVVILDMTARQEHVIINDPDRFRAFYQEHKEDIWVGYNTRNYDQFIARAILCDFNPKTVNDWIIRDERSGWQFSNLFYKVPLINYDVMPNPPIGLKTMEGFMGSNIKETDVPFNLQRRLTPDEITQTVTYCRHDVEQTVEVFLERQDDFDAMMGMCKVFKLPLRDVGKTEAGITAKVLECEFRDRHDEFDFEIESFIHLRKYRRVLTWFKNAKYDCLEEMKQKYQSAPKKQRDKYDWRDPEAFKKYFYKRKLVTDICGIPHIDGWGGIHGAERQIYLTGNLWHVDVGSYYPSYLIAHGRVTRSARHPEKYTEVYRTRMALKKAGKKKEQAPYKKILNAMSGAMKDRHNPAYDPRMNNTMVVNCQLMLIMLLEWLEAEVDGFRLVQSNTDGLIVWIPDGEKSFKQLQAVCDRWEDTCSTDECRIALAYDKIEWIYQKDVNNYLFKFADSSKIERKGKYVKPLSRIDNDLPIINTALVEYMVHGIHPSVTIRSCQELIQFQKLVKLSSKYEYVQHNGRRYDYKCYRVFASRSSADGRIYKCKTGANPAKFADTPDCCFIDNDNILDKVVPEKLDRQWYIDLAIERLRQFGVNL